MYPNHIVPPDEKHIDRLFPKCKPNYNQRHSLQPQRRKTRSKKHYRRAKPKSLQIGILVSPKHTTLNDTSSEELCSSSHHISQESNLKLLTSAQQQQQQQHENLLEPQQTNNIDELQGSALLVDTNCPPIAAEPIVNTTTTNDLCQIYDNDRPISSSNQPASSQHPEADLIPTTAATTTTIQPIAATRRNLTPPGFAQRIHQSPPSNEFKDHRLVLTRPLETTKPETITIHETESIINPKPITGQPSPQEISLPSLNSRSEGQRVKFNDEDLVSIHDGGYSSPPTVPPLRPLDKNSTTAHLTSTSSIAGGNRREQSPPMPIIKEDQNEVESDDAARAIKHTLVNQEAATGSPPAAEVRISSLVANGITTTPPDSLETAEPLLTVGEPMQESQICTGEPEIELRVEETSDKSNLLLRHQRLPNESSHYTLTRATPRESEPKPELPRFSSLQFNTLSEVEDSDAEEVPPTSSVATHIKPPQPQSRELLANDNDNRSVQAPSEPSIDQMRSNTRPTSQQLTNGSSSQSRGGPQTSGNSATFKPSSNEKLPSAILFPCLDDGLSSEPESCDDAEIDDDYERAMDADIEADEDDDDEDDEGADDDDDDDDVESTLNSLNRLAIQQQQQVNSNNNNNNNSSSYSSSSYNQRPHRVHHSSSRQAQQRSSASESQYSTSEMTGDHLGTNASKPTTSLGGLPSSAYYGAAAAANHESYEVKSSSQHSIGSEHWNTTLPSGSASRNSSSQQPAFGSLRNNSTTSTTASNNIQLDSTRDEIKANRQLSSDTDNETDRLLGAQRGDYLNKQQTTSGNSSAADTIVGTKSNNNNSNINSTLDNSQLANSPTKHQQQTSSSQSKEEGVLFNVKYLGSTHNDCEGRSEKEDRILQAEMAVKEVKFRNGVTQSAVEVQLFISTEKIMVLDDKHRKIMMDHSLRTISYIADIGDAFVLIVRKKAGDALSLSSSNNDLGGGGGGRSLLPKISCHVFESSESHTITKSISQAFQVAYAELLKANGGDPNNPNGNNPSYLPRELEYQEVLQSQEMSLDEIEMFARKENQREVIVPKQENEILGISIVESGWGSMLPTVVIASLKHDSPAYRCKRLSIGDVILSVNGISMVGLSLPECQKTLAKTRSQRVAQLTVVPCPITVEVKIKRPDTKYQLGFSVQNGVICSLLRGGIAERGGVRVGHRIMSINGQAVVGVPHEKIVTLLASSVGEIRMKTCLTSIYRHIIGEENPVHL